jgi:hypothetical protein
MGVRFHFLRRGARRVLPFTNLLLGSYWKGSGIEGRAFLSQHFTLQGGGGIDLRRTGSAHGLRLSVDYRRVFATNANRNQLRFVTSYVLGPPGPRTPAGARVASDDFVASVTGRANHQLEPTRRLSFALMSRRRAAQLDRLDGQQFTPN